MAAKYCGQSNLHAVTQSCPSGISFIHTVQGAAQVSRITDVNSVHGLAKSSCEESMASTALKDIHMPERLMENFISTILQQLSRVQFSIARFDGESSASTEFSNNFAATAYGYTNLPSLSSTPTVKTRNRFCSIPCTNFFRPNLGSLKSYRLEISHNLRKTSNCLFGVLVVSCLVDDNFEANTESVSSASNGSSPENCFYYLP